MSSHRDSAPDRPAVQLDHETERKRLEASAVVASSVSRLFIRRSERKISRREVGIAAGFIVLLVVLSLLFHQAIVRQAVERHKPPASSPATTQLQNEVNALQREAAANRLLIQELIARLVKLGVNPKTLPHLPAIALSPGSSAPGFSAPGLPAAASGAASSGSSGSAHAGALPLPVASPGSAPSSSTPAPSHSKAAHPAPVASFPNPTPSNSSPVPLLPPIIPSVPLGLITIPVKVKVG